MKKIILPLFSLSILSGCALVENEKIRQRSEVKQDQAKSVLRADVSKTFSSENYRKSPVVEFSEGVFVTSKSIPSTSDANLPSVFNRVTLRFPGRYNIAAIAERITKETNIPVSIAEDLIASNSGAGPANVAIRAGSGNSAGAITVEDPFATKSGVGQKSFEVYRNTPLSTYGEEFELDYVGSLQDLLDLISAKGRFSWEYKKGVIHLSKTITRTFYLSALPQARSTRTLRTSVGASSGGGTPAGTGTITSNSVYDVFKDLSATLEGLVSPFGKVLVNETTGAITVTDIRDGVDRVSKHVETENKMLSRQARIRVDFLNVRYNATTSAGLDINLAIQSLFNTSGDLANFNVTPGGGLLGGDAGRSVYRVSGRDFNVDFLVQALNNIGRTTVLTRKAVTGLNRQPSTIVASNQTTYLAQTSPGTVSVAGGGGAPGLTPGVVNTGLSLELLPIINNDNSILMQMGLDVSELIRIGTISTGAGATLQQIQTPEVSTMSFLERAVMNNGETLVLVGYEREISKSEGRDALTGISSTAGDNREAFLITLTAFLD